MIARRERASAAVPIGAVAVQPTEDVLDGYVSVAHAREGYGVVIDPATLKIVLRTRTIESIWLV